MGSVGIDDRLGVRVACGNRVARAREAATAGRDRAGVRMRVWMLFSPLALLILFMVAVAGIAGAGWRRARRGEIRTEPRCASCGYNTRGLTSLICPECGTDLREVGIATTRT